MFSPAISSHSRWSAVVVATVLLLIVTLLVPATGAGAATGVKQAGIASKQFVRNSNFSGGVAGWKMNAPAKHRLEVTSSGRNGSGATVKVVASDRTVVFNDARSTVSKIAKGTKFTLTAWVRSSRPGVVAQIKAREIANSNKSTHRAKVRLSNTRWTKVTTTFTTKHANSKLDLNVLFWGIAKGQRLYIDDVTLTSSSKGLGAGVSTPIATTKPNAGSESSEAVSKPSTPVATPTPSTPATQPSAPVAESKPSAPITEACSRPAPRGTQFGSSISTTGQTHKQAVAGVDRIFGELPIIRVFDPGMPFPWSQRRTEVLEGRDLVMSFRPMPQAVLSGKHDAEFRAWFRQAPSASTIYWSYIHEPEPLIDQGKFTADQYRRAWQRINNIADSVCRSNMYPTLILTGWTTTEASKRDWRRYYPGSNVINVMAFDPYNGANNPELRTSYASVPSLFDSVRKVAAEAGKPWAIAETGSAKINSDRTGSGRAKWLRDIAAYTHKYNGLFVTYFHSTNNGEFRLLDSQSQRAWREAVSSSN